MCNFPHKLWFSQKLHLSVDNWPMCHQPWPSLAFPSSRAPLAFPAGAGTCLLVRAVQPVEHSLWSSLCPVPFLHCPLWVSSCHWRQSVRPHRAAPICSGDRHPMCGSCICQAGWVSACWAKQIFIKSQSLPEDVGDLFEYCFSSNLGGFSRAVGSSIYLLHWIPIQRQVFYFLPLPCKGRPPGPPEALGLLPVLSWGLGLITEPLISAHASPHGTMAAIMGVYHHPFCSPENITDPSSGEQCGMLQIAGFSLCFLCLILWYLTPVKSVPAFPSLSVEPRFHPIGRNEFFLCTRWI